MIIGMLPYLHFKNYQLKICLAAIDVNISLSL